MFNSLKRAFKAGATEVRAEYAENKDYLEAVCASCALVANADGNVSDVEKTKVISVISNHPTFSKLYNRNDIKVL
jgi:tellurite resistance protein